MHTGSIWPLIIIGTASDQRAVPVITVCVLVRAMQNVQINSSDKWVLSLIRDTHCDEAQMNCTMTQTLARDREVNLQRCTVMRVHVTGTGLCGGAESNGQLER